MPDEPKLAEPAIHLSVARSVMAPGSLLGRHVARLHRRLWEKIAVDDSDDGCWLWRGARASSGEGYGCIGVAGKNVVATHLVWEFEYGPVPQGMHLLHSCDRTLCCRPSHLFVGTAADNMRDMREKGRGSPPPIRRGTDNHAAKLNQGQVDEIRQRLVVESGANLAREFGVSPSLISAIKCGLIWRAAA